MNDILWNRLSADLKITKFSSENEEEYGSRLIYSALASWARLQVLGKSYTDMNFEDDTDRNYHSVDVNYTQTRVSQVAYGMLNALPHKSSWIKDNDIEKCSNDLASTIVEQLIFCDELSRMNNNRRLTTSPNRIANFINNQLILGGTEWMREGQCSVGIGRWVAKSEEAPDFQDVFNIPRYSSFQYYKALRNNALWQENKLDGKYQIFMIGNNGWYSKSWRDLDKSKVPSGVSIFKNTEAGGGYFLVKNDDDGILSAKLDKWYSDEKEIYRIMYALDANNKTPAIFKAKNKNDHILLHCNSLLPNPERKILLMSSWPFSTYEDIFKRIVPKFLWFDLEKCLNNVGITIQFED